MPISSAQKRRSLRNTFLRCLGITFLLFLPFLIMDKGFFLYCGDYNSQQIPFLYYMEGAFQNGTANYSWATDLGSGFVEAYSFYLLGSPFFWLSTLFPQAWAPYLMVPFTCLKFAVGGIGAYLFSVRYTRTSLGAEMAALLFTFSGFSIYNVFFHFTDAIMLFPLLLWSVDEFFENDRRGFFALMAAVCLLTNYFFFVGQVVFIAIYFLFRVLGHDWKLTPKKFFAFAFEALLGVGLSMVLSLPTVLSVLNNPRVDNFSSGRDLLFYWRTQQYLAIFTSAFLPQDPPYLPNLFPDAAIKWTSMSLYLPLMGMSGVFTYFSIRKKSTFRRLLLTLCVMALVPILNSSFYALNSSFYCRWYYMPLLIMSVCSIKALEDAPRREWLHAVKLCGGITAAYLIFALLPVKGEDGSYSLGVEDNTLMFFLTYGFAMASVIVWYFLLKNTRLRKDLMRRTTILLCTLSIVLAIYHISCGKFPQHDADANYKTQTYDDAGELKAWLDAADSNYYRIDAYSSYTNLGMWLNRSCLQFFHSTVDASIMEFYPMVGVTRDVSSKPAVKLYALRGLLNVKYMVMPVDKLESFYAETEGHTEDYVYAATVGNYVILSYEYYIPFGTSYQYYVTQEQYESVLEGSRSNLLMRALVLDEEQIAKYSAYLTPLSDASLNSLSYAAYTTDCLDRMAGACTSFTADDNGFEAVSNLPEARMVFFSVPYNESWQATIDGQPVTVEKVDDGLCAILCPAGEAHIRFTYDTKGYSQGLFISLICVVIFFLYLAYILMRRWKIQNSGLLPRHRLPGIDDDKAMDDLPLWAEDIFPAPDEPYEELLDDDTDDTTQNDGMNPIEDTGIVTDENTGENFDTAPNDILTAALEEDRSYTAQNAAHADISTGQQADGLQANKPEAELEKSNASQADTTAATQPKTDIGQAAGSPVPSHPIPETGEAEASTPKAQKISPRRVTFHRDDHS